MIEVLYATGLRVSELIAVRPNDLHLDEGYLTCVGKGDKERIVPLGQEAVTWVRKYVSEGRPQLAKRGSPWLFVNARDGGGAVAGRLLEGPQGVRRQSGGDPGAEPARLAPLVRDASAGTRRRPSIDPDDARTLRSVDDTDLHTRPRGAAAEPSTTSSILDDKQSAVRGSSVGSRSQQSRSTVDSRSLYYFVGAANSVPARSSNSRSVG